MPSATCRACCGWLSSRKPDGHRAVGIEWTRVTGSLPDRFPGTGAVALATLLYLYLPIAVVVALSFNEGPMMTIWSGFSTQWYAAALDSEPVRQALANSVVIALVTMTGGTLAATLAALALSGNARVAPGRRAEMAERLIGLPLVVPDIAGSLDLRD